MKISLNWLKDFVDINVSLDVLCQKLVSAGFEVEEVIEQGKNFRNVVLGKLDKVVKNPDADKLKICSVNVGAEQNVQIVTGADNIKEGDIVPVALDNSLLPTGQVIKKGKLRGVESNGMLCSGEELMLTEADYKGAGVYGILIMNEETAPLGTDITKVLGYDDVILDVGVTANRSDCNSVLGIAREVSTVLGVPLKMPNFDYKISESGKSEVEVEVRADDLCPRYMAQMVKDVKITRSPEIIQKRLKAVGLRPINSIVDITNYVLIEIGQPMHAFDLALLSGKKIVVRRAENEKIVALDGNEYTLDDTMLAICDADKPVAVAGIMGGEYSGINENTRDIVFESAKFLRDNIRRTSRKLNLRSDSSFRYERGIDFESQSMGLRRALSLISQYGLGRIVGDTIDRKSVTLEEKTIDVPCAKINDILGIEVPEQTMVDILNSLQIKTTLNEGVLHCVQPSFRDDIENANDLAEEIIRLYGYDYINCTLMDGAHQTSGGKTQAQINVDKLKEIAVSQGMNEILTYSFTSQKSFDVLRLPMDSQLRNAVRLLNPLGEDMSVMRTTLAYSMIATLTKNCLKSNKSAKLFEIAHVYQPSDDVNVQPSETTMMAMGMYGNGCDYYTIKGVIEIILRAFGIKADFVRSALPYLHSGRGADVMAGSHRLGYLGEVHPSVTAALDVKERMYVAEIDVDFVNKIADLGYKFCEIAKYPPVERDIAVVLDEDKAAADIIKVVKKAGGNMLVDCSIFDIYRNKDAIGENKKSVAINLVFRLADRTLTEDEVNAKIDKILKKLDAELGATLR
ncbi:MAG: phenylalanine--tRNA ligase subunit beta [Christensenellales bacterium]